MKNSKPIALIAGFGFIFLAIAVQGIIPAVMKESRVKDVTRTVRTPLGQLKEVKAESAPYSELLERGKRIYLREGCWYCHSHYVRPTAREEERWGPVSQVGEYAFDLPHTFGTRRIGPDLTRVGGKYGDDWHVAHFYDPRMVVSDSIMPRFKWYFKLGSEAVVPDEDLTALTAYVQNLGMNRGKWRDAFGYQILAQGSSSISVKGSVDRGKAIYERRCIGCHGDKGDGKGPAAKFFVVAQPRDFTWGVYKFRTTPTGSLPLDSDIYRTISVGIRGTAMPPWYNLSESDRWDVIQYIKTFAPDFKEYPPDPPITITIPPKPSEAMIAAGKRIFEEMKCWECHGRGGRGDGPKSDGLEDDFGNRIPPANFTKGVFKSGPRVEDIFRSIMTGLSGTPMPSYSDAFTASDDGWAISYYILSLSADE